MLGRRELERAELHARGRWEALVAAVIRGQAPESARDAAHRAWLSAYYALYGQEEES